MRIPEGFESTEVRVRDGVSKGGEAFTMNDRGSVGMVYWFSCRGNSPELMAMATGG